MASRKEHTEAPRVRVNRQFERLNVWTGAKEVHSSEEKQDSLEIRTFVTEPAKVSLAKGITLNLNNFEFARIDVSIQVPTYLEEADEAFKYAKSWVESRVTKEVEEVREGSKSDT